MKKFVIVLLLASVFLIPTTALAASNKQVNEINLAIKNEEKVATKHFDLGGEYLYQLIHNKLSVQEKDDLRKKVNFEHEQYQESCDRLLKLRIKLYVLTEAQP